MKKTFNYILTGITILFFLLAVYIMIFGAIARKNNTLLNVFGYSYSAVPTSSMEGGEDDSFDAGSFVITKKVPYEEIKELDVIVFQSDDKLIIHRVIKINEDGSLVTKGDNNLNEDINPVTKETYQAKMIKHFSFFGLGKTLGSYQLLILGLIIIVLIIYIIYQIFALIISVHKNRIEKMKLKK